MVLATLIGSDARLPRNALMALLKFETKGTQHFGMICCDHSPAPRCSPTGGDAAHWDFSANIDEEVRHVRKVINERPLFLSLGGKSPHPLLLPLGYVEIAVGPDGDSGVVKSLPE